MWNELEIQNEHTWIPQGTDVTLKYPKSKFQTYSSPRGQNIKINLKFKIRIFENLIAHVYLSWKLLNLILNLLPSKKSKCNCALNTSYPTDLNAAEARILLFKKKIKYFISSQSLSLD